MSGTDSAFCRRIARHLAAHAKTVLPHGREEWAQAMRNEIEQLTGGGAALRWALGCVLTSYSERLRSMKIANPVVSRWVLALEMLVCFTPLTLLCLAVIANLGRMQGAGVLYLSVAAVGPIGLMVAFKTVVLNRPAINRFIAVALCIMATWTVLAYSLSILAHSGGSAGDWWREFVLIALLPALGIAHLVLLGLHQAGKYRHTSALA